MNPYEREVYKAARGFNRARSGCLMFFLMLIGIFGLVWLGIGYGVFSFVRHVENSHDERLQREADDKQRMIEWEKAHPVPKVEPR